MKIETFFLLKRATTATATCSRRLRRGWRARLSLFQKAQLLSPTRSSHTHSLHFLKWCRVGLGVQHSRPLTFFFFGELNAVG